MPSPASRRGQTASHLPSAQAGHRTAPGRSISFRALWKHSSGAMRTIERWERDLASVHHHLPRLHPLRYLRRSEAQEVSHHPDVHITWQRIEFRITTHDAGHPLTEADFELAKGIDAIAERRGTHIGHDSKGSAHATGGCDPSVSALHCGGGSAR